MRRDSRSGRAWTVRTVSGLVRWKILASACRISDTRRANTLKVHRQVEPVRIRVRVGEVREEDRCVRRERADSFRGSPISKRIFVVVYARVSEDVVCDE